MRLLSCLCALTIVLACSLANQFNNGTVATTAPVQETLTIDFKSGTHGVLTKNAYSGPLVIQVEGVGQASGSEWSDAFYIYKDSQGSDIQPWHSTEFYNWMLWINGEPADSMVEIIPQYNPDHVYVLVIKAPGGRLRFAVGDTGTNDNSGSWQNGIQPIVSLT